MTNLHKLDEVFRRRRSIRIRTPTSIHIRLGLGLVWPRPTRPRTIYIAKFGLKVNFLPAGFAFLQINQTKKRTKRYTKWNYGWLGLLLNMVSEWFLEGRPTHSLCLHIS